ncbi:MAG: nucleotidyltransferase domain-containing protein [Bacteroidales bacterium]|jgi:predicted nucleotidyltransferase|nr:nucleotidyltransferase domain-containing protein [Bacteroidales bacterium]HQB20834.1 nucleotidyltransferase domain-containing protein [Bacteroidales bacterium]
MIKLTIKTKEHFDHYLFGSVLYSDNPTDLDIAIIYDKKFISIQEAIKYRHELIKKLSEVTQLQIDTILLSKEEEKETEFLSNSKHQLI